MERIKPNTLSEEELLLELIQNDRVGEFAKKIDELFPAKKTSESSVERLLSLFQYLDLTSLESTTCVDTIKQLVEQSEFEYGGVKYSVAGICSYTNLVNAINDCKQGRNIKSVVVSAGFPTSQMPLEAKIEEVKYALENGADEIDICINRALFLSGKETEIENELSVIRNAVSDFQKPVLLKVILETGELKSLSNIMKASMLALHCGADFIKTSTGKIPQGADKYSVCVMLLALRQYYRESGEIKGLKVAGGIRTPEQALQYRELFDYFINKDLKSNVYFRVGCSSLIENLKTEIQNRE